MNIGDYLMISVHALTTCVVACFMCMCFMKHFLLYLSLLFSSWNHLNVSITNELYVHNKNSMLGDLIYIF